MESSSAVSLVNSWLEPGRNLFVFVHLLGIASFAYIAWQRFVPLARAQRDVRFDRPMARLGKLTKFWFGQWKHPRYPGAGVLHILIFTGFILLVIRSFSTLLAGVFNTSTSIFPGKAGHLYDLITDYAATIVFACMLVAIVRRLVFQPARYTVPARYGKAHTADAIFLLALIAVLMAADSLFSAAVSLGQISSDRSAEGLAFLSLPWIFQVGLDTASLAVVAKVCFTAYLVHAVAFYFLLCYRPFGIQFHVETSLFNVYFAKLDRGTVKPVRWGVPDDKLDEIKSFGVKTFEDFT
jgi:hypothetical protein